MDFQYYFGWLATYLTALFYISLVTPFLKIFKGQMKYQDAPIFVIYVSYINCILWCLYGEMILSYQIRTCNIIGSISTFILIFIYLSYDFRKHSLDPILTVIIIIYGTYVFYNYFTVIITNNQFIIGNLCVMAKFCVFTSPIQLIYRVIREKNYILIPIYASFVSLISSICWVIYGFTIKNIHVIFPNTIGIILGITQYYVYFYYKSHHFKRISENNKTITIDNSEIENEHKEDVAIINNQNELNRNNKI